MASYETVQEVLSSGYAPLYAQVLPHMEEEEITADVARFVYDTLDMFVAFRRSREKYKIEPTYQGTFGGFDGNDETNLMGFASFVVEKQKRWTTLGITNFNSHMPNHDTYRRMLEAWKNTKPDKWNLTQEDITRIEAAAIHPSNRTAST